MSSPLSLSVVVPCFDEQRRIGGSLAELCRVLDALWHADWEVVVVDDQSTDATVEVVEQFLASRPEVRLVRSVHGKGKGAAVRTGVLAAAHDAIAVVDADLAGDVTLLPEMCARLSAADAVLGSRLLRGAVVEPARTVGRRAAAWIFRGAVRLMTPLRVSDPQCGFKVFRRDAVQPQIALMATNGYGYEVELLLRLQRAGARLVEFPVTWREGSDSKVRVAVDGLQMLRELWAARSHTRT
ncbi:MAG: glycosyltransferase [Ilumatobacteraceae bacterium]